jgi:hypothetical protein
MAFPGCNSTELLQLVPCFQCLGKDQLQAIKTLLMCQIQGGRAAVCDPATLQSDAACLVCMSDQDIELLEVALLCALAVERGDRESGSCDVQTLVDETKCLMCLPPHDLRAIFAVKLCQWFETIALLEN